MHVALRDYYRGSKGACRRVESPRDSRNCGHTALGMAWIGGIRPHRLEYWRAYGTVGCRIGRQDRPTLSPYGKRLSGI